MNTQESLLENFLITWNMNQDKIEQDYILNNHVEDYEYQHPTENDFMEGKENELD